MALTDDQSHDQSAMETVEISDNGSSAEILSSSGATSVGTGDGASHNDNGDGDEVALSINDQVGEDGKNKNPVTDTTDECGLDGDNVAVSGSGNDDVNAEVARQQELEQEQAVAVDQPSEPQQQQHSPDPRLAQAQDPSDSASAAAEEHITEKARENNDTTTQHVSSASGSRSNYTSAPTSVLGNDSDKNDFCRGAAAVAVSTIATSSQSPSHDNDDHQFQENSNNGTALNKLKQWFASSPTGSEENMKHEGNDAHDDYHNFSSPNPSRGSSADETFPNETTTNNNNKESVRKQSLDDNGYDESLLDEDEKGEGDVELGPVDSSTATSTALEGKDPSKRRSWGKPTKSPQTISIPGTSEEERVMGQCAFFYDKHDDENNDNLEANNTIKSHRIPEVDTQPNDDDEESQGYFEAGQVHPHYHRNRRLNPRAMAHAIKTHAKRKWTERRYRRRLRQSQLQIGASHNPNNDHLHSSSNNRNTDAADDDEFAYELTKEHRQAFLAAHAALNGKRKDEYTRNRGAIRKQFGYDYDIDYDLELESLELGLQDSIAAEGEEEIRADLTNSSLAIRGGLIRMPTDNVRLVCDPQLQSGILSIETRDVSGGMMGYENYGNANRYGNIHGSGVFNTSLTNQQPPPLNNNNNKTDMNGRKEQHRRRERANSKDSISEQHWRRQELAYVLTVDENIYRGLVQEMGDSHRIPCGVYYCCHGTDGGDHVGIGVAIVILLVTFFFLVLGMIAWPTW